MRKLVQILMMAMMVFSFCQTPVLALLNERIMAEIQLNSITPGARATAMGGAFIGLADDATAVESNPAGLIALTEPEISFEMKSFEYTTEAIYKNDKPKGDMMTKEFENYVNSPSFMSLIFPVVYADKNISFAIYRHEQINYKSAFRTDKLPIYPDKGEGWVFSPIDASIDLSVTSFGVAATVELMDTFSMAVSPKWSIANMRSHTFNFDGDPSTRGVSATDFSPGQIQNETRIDDKDGAFSGNIGILWKVHPKFSIGAVYKRGPEFALTEVYEGKDFWYGFYSVRPEGDAEYYANIKDQYFAFDTTLKVPDSFGIGGAYRPNQNFTVTLDTVYIQYKDLLENFQEMHKDGPSSDSDNEYLVDNATEFHVGMEYLIPLENKLLALRTGIYNDPDHAIRVDKPESGGHYLFLGGKDQIHITGGIGLTYSERFQVDIAGNIAEFSKQFSISAVYKF